MKTPDYEGMPIWAIFVFCMLCLVFGIICGLELATIYPELIGK